MNVRYTRLHGGCQPCVGLTWKMHVYSHVFGIAPIWVRHVWVSLQVCLECDVSSHVHLPVPVPLPVVYTYAHTCLPLGSPQAPSLQALFSQLQQSLPQSGPGAVGDLWGS